MCKPVGSYKSLNKQLIKGNISFWVHLKLSIQISPGPGDRYKRIKFILDIISPFRIGISKSLESYSCLIFCNKISFSALTSIFSRFLKSFTQFYYNFVF